MSRVAFIDSLNDPRVACYRNLKDRDLARAPGGLFLAEGEQLVRRLIDSRFEIDSVLLAERRAAEILPIVPEEVTVYVARGEVVNEILGYKFHSGVMAAARRGPSPVLDDVVGDDLTRPLLLVVCPEIANTDNLGSLIRISAGFGADAMILGERSCDPFFRQAVRVSMGAVFTLPIVRSDDIARDLRLLGTRDVERVAAVLDISAEPLSTVRCSSRVAILFGNEAQGLSAEQVQLCDRRATIPMKRGTDSLNVSVAAGVFLYHFTNDDATRASEDSIRR